MVKTVFEDGTENLIEGFGPNTVIGAVSDLMLGNYSVQSGKVVDRIEIFVSKAEIDKETNKWGFPKPHERKSQ